MAEDFWDFVCNHRHYLQAGFLFAILLLLFTVVSLFLGKPGSVSYTLAIVDLILVAVLIVITLGPLWVCVRRDIT